MSERRGGFAFGLVWAVLSIGAGALLPSPPGADADAAGIDPGYDRPGPDIDTQTGELYAGLFR